VLVTFEVEQRPYDSTTSSVKLDEMINVYGGFGKNCGGKLHGLFNPLTPNDL
jgi:hypothetical protein